MYHDKTNFSSSSFSLSFCFSSKKKKCRFGERKKTDKDIFIKKRSKKKKFFRALVLTCTTRIRHKSAPTRMIIPHHARNGKKRGHTWIRTKVMGYHLSTRILFMRPCEVSKSPNTDTLLFPSKVILEPHLQILTNYII